MEIQKKKGISGGEEGRYRRKGRKEGRGRGQRSSKGGRVRQNEGKNGWFGSKAKIDYLSTESVLYLDTVLLVA